MPALTVQNAEIKTATVEIKTLTVSGKQVTLAVFRQLREVPILGDDGVLVGEPWGVVNYHPDKCADDPEHCHVVWQRGTDLLRSKVSARYSTGPRGEFWSGEANEFIDSCIHEYVATGKTRFFGGDPPIANLNSYRTEPGIVERVQAGFLARMIPSGKSLKVVQLLKDIQDQRNALNKYPNDERTHSRLHETERDFAQAVAELGAEVHPSAEEAHADYKAAIADEAERRARHAAARETIAALPQLFIAV